MMICEEIIFWAAILMLVGFAVILSGFIFKLADAVYQHDKGDF